MLTAKIGETIINCFDNKYNRFRLKEWSYKGILKCPVCNGEYEYCHGDTISPYFRHIGKECDGYYSETESEEHKEGKQLLFNWIKKQKGISNCQLESWIPETKQRPDIYFEYNGERFVLEFQCTPIASEFLARRELYRLTGINDIWILGTQKYSIYQDKKGNPYHAKRYKAIEKELSKKHLMYLDVKNKLLISNSNLIPKDSNLQKAIKVTITDQTVRKLNLFDTLFYNGDFFINELLGNLIFKRGKITIGDEISSLFKSVKDYYLGEESRIKKEKEAYAQKYKEIKEIEKRLKEELGDIKYTSEYIGVIGQEINEELLLAEEVYFWTYNSYLYKFIDGNGNIITWMTSTNPNIRVGDYVEIQGKVKSHSVYEEYKQTRIARCKVTNISQKYKII